MSTDNFITIRTYHDHIIGEIVLSALKNAGIKVFTIEDTNNMITTENHLAIKVHEDDVDAALEIIEAQEGL